MKELNSNVPALEPRAIAALKGMRFRIPSFQRGYRWERLQVEQLLEDIVESDAGVPYYLQPVVVAPCPDDYAGKIRFDYDLIDGQQRLTTILLLLKALTMLSMPLSADEMRRMIDEDRSVEITDRMALVSAISHFDVSDDFCIIYETRLSSELFLEKVSSLDPRVTSDKALITESPDHLYMWHAFNTIVTWLKSHPITSASRIAEVIKSRVRIIWYELPETVTDWKKFTDLNIGKIPLTNSELVKALFLRSDNFSGKNNEEAEEYEKQTLVAQWDQIERELTQDAFWGFLTRKSPSGYPTRIDLIFDLIAGTTAADRRDPFFTFNYFVRWFREHGEMTGKKKWEQIYLQYQRLRDWYGDRRIYHMLGYLVAVDYPRDILGKIFRFACGSGKRPNRSNERVANLLERLVTLSLRMPHDRKFKDVKTFRDLKYNIADEPEKREDKAHHEMIRRYLTLYNIMVMESAGPTLRYSFAHHNTVKGGWSLEHIHAQKSQSLNKGWQWVEWIKNHTRTLEGIERAYSKDEAVVKDVRDLIERMKEYKEADGRERFNKLADVFRGIIESLPGANGLYQDEMANMALLGRDGNSTLNNSTFDVKRRKILEMLSTDFVPVATERVFLKAVDGCDTEHLFFWGQEDRDAYMEDMNKKLSKYIGNGKSK